LKLLHDKWIKAIVDGQAKPIAVGDIINESVTDLAFTRLDFNGAIYQFLIGLLQSTMAPKNVKGWAELYLKPPSVEQLQQAFAQYADAFELLPDEGPAFMQDLTLLKSEGEAKSVAVLLIEAPGAKTIKDNTDHFIKRGFADQMCESCVTAALYCLQSSAPAGGSGHRTSLRGGGGLTTLLIPSTPSNLWQKLWLNVLPLDEPALQTEHTEVADIFPWLAAPKTSEKKGTEILMSHTNPLQMFWGTPRRIRLDGDTCEPGFCAVCGDESAHNFTHFTTKNYGPNYGDGWTHFLTPYRFDIKDKKPPLSVKGKKGGLSYKDWLGIAIGSKAKEEQPAIVVQHYMTQKRRVLKRLAPEQADAPRLWCFAYDMDNMKARCWYEHTLPLLAIPDSEKELVLARIGDYLQFAIDTASVIRQSVKQAWFKRVKDAKGDMSKVDVGFWQATESDFFALVKLVIDTAAERERWAEADKFWRAKMIHQLNHQFEHWTLDRFDGDKDLPRIMAARESLHKVFYSLKTYKDINKRYLAAQKEVA
jgi:CRISPR system Cascade subunit CasA